MPNTSRPPSKVRCAHADARPPSARELRGRRRARARAAHARADRADDQRLRARGRARERDRVRMEKENKSISRSERSERREMLGASISRSERSERREMRDRKRSIFCKNPQKNAVFLVQIQTESLFRAAGVKLAARPGAAARPGRVLGVQDHQAGKLEHGHVAT